MKKFQKNKENFICANCGTKVKGNGYTNHCPHCLVSRHVDINPGDRKNDCGGLMDPIDIEKENGEYIIIHKCKKCGEEKRNKVAKEDNLKLIKEISQSKPIPDKRKEVYL
ncbi:MAG TPA: RNHCP domain-containing protein [Candidatus Paceibacterota bacterium]|nr:RNHCP domain-containing protein [Candidatus Paceibacterota bacterium]